MTNRTNTNEYTTIEPKAQRKDENFMKDYKDVKIGVMQWSQGSCGMREEDRMVSVGTTLLP